MQPPLNPRSGFQLIQGGIYYWSSDATNVVNKLGPIALLELLRPGAFMLQTTTGQRFGIVLTARQVAEFDNLGGTFKTTSESLTKEQLIKRSGFQKTDEGVFFWNQGSDNNIRLVGPIVDLEQMQDDRYAVVTRNGRHYHRLASEDLDDFHRLGGTVTNGAKPPVSEDRDKAVSPTKTGDQENGEVRDGLETNTNRQNLQTRTLQWYGARRLVTFGPHRIQGPLAYFSSGKPPDEEASCIDITLPVGKPVIEPRGALGYRPAYDRITPDQRANYLTWLAGGRDGNLDDIGYALLFFYGLERRVLVENQDIYPVVWEVVRLLHIYEFSVTLTSYLSHFLAYVIARAGLEKKKHDWFHDIFEKKSIQPTEEIVALAAVWHLKQNRPLSPTLAMRMAERHPLASRSAVTTRLTDQFHALFAKKLENRFGNGFFVRAIGQDRVVDYKKPASPTLLDLRNHNQEFVRPVAIPDILGLPSQFLPLVEIWEECIRELTPQSRQLATTDKDSSRTNQHTDELRRPETRKLPGEILLDEELINRTKEKNRALEEILGGGEVEASEENDAVAIKLHPANGHPAGEPLRLPGIPLNMPAAREPQLQTSVPEFALDDDLIGKIRAQDASKVLGEIFGDGTDIEEEPLSKSNSNISDSESSLDLERFPGLQERYHSLMSELLLRDDWLPRDFENAVRRHDLMPQAAMAHINQWAHDNFDDFLIEGELQGGESLRIHRKLIREFV